MAMITQRGVDRFTAGTRQRFAAENEQFDRAQRLKRAARGPLNFDMEGEAAARRVQMERLRQQQQDIGREEAGVRGRFADPAGQEFQSSQRLFDAEDVSILPEAVLAIGMNGGRMARSELVRTEKDRVNGGGRSGWDYDAKTGITKSRGWDANDDWQAGAALGSRKMMGDAAESMRPTPEDEADAYRQQISANRDRDNLTRAKRVNEFDVSVASGTRLADGNARRELAGLPTVKPRAVPRFKTAGEAAAWVFPQTGSGGTMQRGGETYRTNPVLGSMDMIQRPKPAVPVVRAGQPVRGPAVPEMGMAPTPEPVVIDQRYNGSGSPVRTGATARSPVFEMDGAGDGVPSPEAGQGFSGVPASELFAQATGAKASPGMPDVSLFDAFGEASRRFKGKAKDATKGAIWNKKPTGRGMYGGEVRKDSKGRYDTGSR